MRTLAASFALCASLMLSIPNANAAFIQKGNFGVGANPVGAAVGDFNGDTHRDLAVANQGSDNISVLLGRGDGTFEAAVNYSAGQYPTAVALGDFDGNGQQDLAVANSGEPGAVSVLLGNANGTFQMNSNYTTLSDPVSLVVADFNGDNRPDLAAAHYLSQGSVSVLLGRGNGTFESAVDYPTGRNPFSLAAGDFNGDTRPDLAVADEDGVSILLGNGDGAFQDFVNYPAGVYVESVAVGRFDADSYLDLAVANDDFPGTVSVLLGNGDGSFRGPTAYRVGNYPLFVAAADLNGDTHLDLAVVDEGGVSVLSGNGNGTFGAPSGFTAGSNPLSLVVEEFSSDQWLDVAVVNYNPDGTVSTFLNSGAPPGLKEALDTPELAWTTTGAKPWIYQTNVTHDRVDAARAGRLRRGQSSILQTSVVGPGTLSFWWKVGSDTKDRLQFFIDGVAKPRARRPWRKPTFAIPAGTHVLRWQYKNIAATGLRNHAWLDEVSFVPAAAVAASQLPTALSQFENGDATATRIAVSHSQVNGEIRLIWPADASKSYQILYKDSLSDPRWRNLDIEPVIQDGLITVKDATTTQPQRFYRVIEE